MGIDFATEIGLQQDGVGRLVGPGPIVMPNTPAFSVYGCQGLVPAGYDYVYTLEKYDLNSNYNPVSGRFTAPVAGVYYFYGSFLADNVAANEYRHCVVVNGTAVVGGTYIMVKPSGFWTMYCDGYANMAVGDYASVYRIQGGATWNDPSYSAFGGYLIT